MKRAWIATALLLGTGFCPVTAADGSRGRALFESGAGASARIFGMSVPAARFACQRCHGRDGRGGREGATAVPAIEWDALAAQNSSRPAYTPQSFHRAVSAGVSSAGVNLDKAMPRYDIDRGFSDELVTYLRELPEIERRGVGSDTVHVGILSTPRSRSVSDIYRAYLEAASTGSHMSGRIFGRSLVLRSIAIDSDSDLMSALARNPVIAIVGLAPADSALSKILVAQGIPVLFPLFPLDGDEDNDLARGLSPDWNTIFETIVDRMVANGHRNLLIVTDDKSGFLTERAISAAKKGNVTAHLSSPEIPIDRNKGYSESAVLVLLPADSLNDELIAAMPRGATLYGLGGQMLPRLPVLKQLGMRYEIAVENTTAVEHAVRSGSPVLQSHANLVAELLRSLLRGVGRDVRRTSLMAQFAGIRWEVTPNMRLDYKTDTLNGTRRVRFIRSP